MPRALEGIRVIEWTALHAGPSAGSKLGELGAEVIKIEEPGVGERGRGLRNIYGIPTALPENKTWFFEVLNYNKKGIALNLRTEQGRAIAHRLVEKADVFLSNMRPSALVKNELEYETLSRRHPRLIHASYSFVGHAGPFSEVAGQEPIAQAWSGLMSVTGEPEMPPQQVWSAITDQAGSMLLAQSVVTALLARERFGIGQKIEISQLGASLLLQILNMAYGLLLNQDSVRVSRTRPWNALVNYYKCKDDRWIALAMGLDAEWQPFCEVVGRGDLADDPRFADSRARELNGASLHAILADLFLSRTSSEWEALLRKHDLQYAPVNSTLEAIRDPQTVANKYVTEVEHPVLGKVKWLLTPIHYSETPVQFFQAAPEVGQHTEEVLIEVGGYSWEDIVKFRDQGVI